METIIETTLFLLTRHIVCDIPLIQRGEIHMTKRAKTPQTETVELVTRVYKRTGSIGETALQTEISTTKVRKILITEGLWSSDRSIEIGELSDQGKSSSDIAEELGISRAMVQNYLPYEKGLYDEPRRSDTAIRSEKYRERNRAYAQKGQEREKQPLPLVDTIEEANTKTGKQPPFAMHLHLELRGSRLDSMDKNEAKILAKYGGVTTSISRDVIVPSSLALHQLHYLINMAFGWTNSHLHKFQLPQPLYEKLTEGKLLDIIPVFGYYLKYPSHTFYDAFWDDDYEEHKSPRTWMRSKYLKRYKYRGISDYWIDNQTELLDLVSRFPVLNVSSGWWNEPRQSKKVNIEDATLQDLLNAFVFDEGMPDVLKESLRLSEILSVNPREIELARDVALETDNTAILSYQYYRDILIKELQKKGHLRNQAEFFYALNEMERIQKETEPVDVMPITNQLLYSYDYGDGWEIDITLVEEFGNDNQPVDDETIAKVIATHKPICIAKDGLNVVDDCMHISGYTEMLQTIHEGEPEEAQEMKEWARGQGWTGRNVNPKYLI
jgi:predicted transcriptional regulator